MAEEKPTRYDFESSGMDDMSVLNVLLQRVKGLSPISSSPVLEPIPIDNSLDEPLDFTS